MAICEMASLSVRNPFVSDLVIIFMQGEGILTAQP